MGGLAGFASPGQAGAPSAAGCLGYSAAHYFIVLRPGKESSMEIKRVTPEKAKELLDSNSGYVYLDVRTVQEFDAGHVLGAKNIPVLAPDAAGRMQLNPRFVEIVEANFDKDAKLITGCQMGGRSLKAAGLLLSSGFSDVVDMRGGLRGETDSAGRLTFPGWEPRGLPTSRDSQPGDRYENLSTKEKK
jgi:rhodanese-related sulfurtransferase